MSSSKIVAAVLLSLASLSVAACSGGAAGTTSSNSSAATSASSLSDFCTSICEPQHTCDSTSAVQTCVSKCQNSNAVIYPKLRADTVSAVEACMPEQDCATVLKGDALDDCYAEALATLAPSAAAVSFCKQWDDAEATCDMKIDQAKCLSLVKKYNDATLQTAQACTSQSCSGMEPCIEAALAGDN